MSRIASRPVSTIASRSMPSPSRPSAAFRTRAPRRSPGRPLGSPSLGRLRRIAPPARPESSSSVNALPSSMPPTKYSNRSTIAGSSSVGRANGRHLDRVVVQDRRLDQLRLDEVAERVVDELRPGPFAAVSTPRASSRRAELVGVARPEPVLLERVDELDPPPGRRELDLVAAERDLRRPDRLVRDGRDELLDPLHRVVVVRVGLVPLDHRELGVVLVRDALVAEVLGELVDPLEPADDQPLEVQLGRDPQVEVAVELVRVRDERARRTRRRSAAAGSASRPRRTRARRGSGGSRVTIRARSSKSARVSSFISRSR